MTNEEAIQLLEKARMDFTNGQGKLTDVMNAIRSGAVTFREPADPLEHIRRLIRNGVVVDATDLEAEMRGWPALTAGEAQTLRLEAVHLWERQAAA